VGAEPFDASRQAQVFESAAVLFHSGQYHSAWELFRQAARGPSRAMVHTAQVYARMCQRRLAAADTPRTPEEHYNLAVALVNERRFEAAEKHLRAALAQAPDADHLYYVLALCRGLGGDLAGACTHMKRAIELRPQNRVAARNDPDFAEIGEQPPLAELLYPERTRWM
jgi:tetratricopeptide (TPR) repeat protein